MTKKRGRPAFPQEHRTLNVYLPNDLHDRLGKWAAHLKCSRSALIRDALVAALNNADENKRIKEFIEKALAK